MNKKEIFRTIKFTLFSISAGIVEIVVFTLLNLIPNWSYWPKYLIALVASVLWNFTLNREFTFKATNNVPVAMLKVALFYCVFAPLSTWWTHEFTAMGINEYLIEIGTMAVNLVTEYLYCRFVVYRNSMNTRN